MDDGEWITYCGECSLRLDEPHDMELGTRPPCPDCGSFARAIRWTGPNAAQMMTGIKVLKRPGQRRSPVESIMGDSYWRSKGKWMRIHRIIDRRRNRYYEKVHDPETREVIREVDEPLTEHRNRGDAKRVC